MSSISGGIGGAMGISIGGGLGVGAAGGASIGGSSSVSSANSITGPSTPTAGLPESLQSLTNTLKDFSSAEILIALMLSGGGRDKDDEKGSSGAAGAFLAGMALAGMMGQQAHLNLQVDVPLGGANGGANGAGSGAGLSLNVSL